MILDESTQFGAARALAYGATGTALISNVIDLGATRTTLSGNAPMLVIRVSRSGQAVGGAGATAKFILASDAQAAIATDGSATHHFATGPVPFEVLEPGYLITAFALPLGPYERYLGILQTTGTAAFVAGKVDMFLTDAAKVEPGPAEMTFQA